MGTYKGIQGYRVQSLASDPPVSDGRGQLWYNSTSNTWKIGTLAAGTWAATNTINTGRANPGGAGATVPTAIIFGGSPSPTVMETYDGTSWSTDPAVLNTGRTAMMSGGTATAALAAGGDPGHRNETESYDGSSWASLNPINSARQSGGFSGTTTAAVIFSGGTWNQPPLHKLTEEWNGTGWTEVADLIDSHQTNVGSFGQTSTAAMCVSGYYYPPGTSVTHVEQWNGTSWTEKTAIPTGGYFTRGAGIVTAGMIVGGADPPAVPYRANTRLWDGSAWSESGDLASGRNEGAMAKGSPSAANIYSGGSPGNLNLSEVWDGAPVAIQTVTTS